MTNVSEAINSRLSTNQYDRSQKLSVKEIENLIELATKAPSAFNAQNWKFIAVHSDEAKNKLLPLAYSQPKIVDSAVTFIIVGTTDVHNTLPDALKPAVDSGILSQEIFDGWVGAAQNMYGNNPVLQRDEAIRSGTLAAMTLMLAAKGLGLASCPMIGFDAAGVASAFSLSDTEVPVMLVTVGSAIDGNWPRKPRKQVSQVLSLV